MLRSRARLLTYAIHAWFPRTIDDGAFYAHVLATASNEGLACVGTSNPRRGADEVDLSDHDDPVGYLVSTRRPIVSARSSADLRGHDDEKDISLDAFGAHGDNGPKV